MSRTRSKKIEVFSPGNFSNSIAVFDSSPVHNQEAQKELMINPQISIEQNGSSILTFSMDIGSEKWGHIKNPKNIYEVDGRRYTALNANAYSYKGNIVSVNLVETWYLLSTVFVQAYNVPAKREGIDEHSVCLLPKSTEPLVINGVTYSDSEVPYPRGSAGYNLWALLKPTNWSLGTCDVIVDGFSPAEDFGVFNVETDMESVLDNIKLVQELYGGILVFDSINQIVHLRDETKWNTDTGFEVREGKNLATPPVIEQNNEVRTVAYPLGDGNLNIKAVNGGVNYVTNFGYTSERYVTMLKNPDIYDQKQLKFWGERELAKIAKPRKNIEAQIVDISTTQGHEFEVFDINDIATVFYTDPDSRQVVSEKQRIISLRYMVFAPYSATIELGDKKKNTRDILKQAFDASVTIGDKFSGKGTISGDNVLIDDPFAADDDTGSESSSGKGYSSKASITKIANEEHAMIQLHAEYITDNSKALADFKVEATKTFATVESVAQYSKKSEEYTSNAVAGLKTYVDGDFARNTLSASYTYTNNKTGEVSNSLASFKQEVGRNYATQTLVSQVNDKVAKIEIKANNNRSEIIAQADVIRLKADVTYVDNLVAGYVKATNLDATVANLGYSKIKKADITTIITQKVDGNYFSGKNVSTKGLTSSNISTQAFATRTMSLGGTQIGWRTIEVPQSASYNPKTGNVTLYNKKSYTVLG